MPFESKTLVLDIGTRMGFAVLENGRIVESDSFALASEAELKLQRREGKERTLDLRFTRLRQFIRTKIAAGVTRIVFEDVHFASTPAQTQLWASLRAAIWAAAEEFAIQVFCLHASSLKAFATGNGGAEKIDMARALAQAEPGRYTLDGDTLRLEDRTADDNEVDALWLAKFTLAVDSGRQRFLSPYQRDCIEQEEKRRKRQELKAARKAREKAKEEAARVRHMHLKQAAKAAGRCCGVFRKLEAGGRAVCPKCRSSIPLHFATVATAEATAGLHAPP